MTVLFADDFNRANGALGANWSMAVGTAHTIVSNNMQSGGSNPSSAYANATAMTAVADMKASIKRTSASWDGGPTVRQSASADTCYYLDAYGSNNWEVYRRVAGADTLVGSASQAHANGDTFSLQVSGVGATVTLKMFLNGVQVGSDISDADAARLTAAGHGGVLFWGGTYTADDFSVEDLAAGDTLFAQAVF